MENKKVAVDKRCIGCYQKGILCEDSFCKCFGEPCGIVDGTGKQYRDYDEKEAD